MLFPPRFWLCGVYAVLCPLFWARHKTGRDLGKKNSGPTASALRAFMLLYNVVMSAFSAYCFYVMYDTMGKYDVKTNDCRLFDRDPRYKAMGTLFYLSKYVEFLDTFFLVARAKRVSWLHYLHHIGAPIDMGLIMMTGTEVGWIFIFLNSIIHTMMYGYYALLLVGVRPPGKVFITFAQIVQFFTGFYIIYDYKNVPCYGKSAANMVVWWYNYIYVGLVLFLFLIFFLREYVMGANKKKKNAAKQRKQK